MHDSFSASGISKRARDFRVRQVERLTQDGLGQQRQFRLDVVEFQFAGNVGDRDAQELLMTKGPNRIEAGLEIRASLHQTGKLVLQLFAVAAAPARDRSAPACRAYRDDE